MPKYKAGKQEKPVSFQEFKERVEKARLSAEKAGFIWLLYYAGCRKSEAYERTAEDCQVTESHFIIDFHQRKKHGARVPALRFPISWPGIEQLFKLYERASSRKPQRKRIFYQEDKTTKSNVLRDHWLFPHIQSATALRLVKQVLGSNYYPHFLRLNRITELLSDSTVNITRIKSYTGIKTVEVIQAYLGTSEKEQESALSWIDKKINEKTG
jgi:integrase